MFDKIFLRINPYTFHFKKFALYMQNDCISTIVCTNIYFYCHWKSGYKEDTDWLKHPTTIFIENFAICFIGEILLTGKKDGVKMDPNEGNNREKKG